MSFDRSDLLFLALGGTVLLPLGARLAGNKRLAKRLDLLPRFSFGLLCAAMAVLPGVTFFIGDPTTDQPVAPASELGGRIVSGLFALWLIGGGLRILIKRDFDRPDSDDDYIMP